MAGTVKVCKGVGDDVEWVIAEIDDVVIIEFLFICCTIYQDLRNCCDCFAVNMIANYPPLLSIYLSTTSQ